jgi:amino acid transporter
MLVRHERPRDLRWYLAGPMFFGDLGTSRLYVLGLAVYFAGTAAPYYVAAICALVFLVGWAYTIICRIMPDGGGVYSSGRMLHPLLGAVGAIMLFANYVVTAAISTYEAVRYIGAPFQLPADSLLVPIFVVLAFILLFLLNFVGSRRAGTFALVVAVASVGITALLAAMTIQHLPEGWQVFRETEHTATPWHKWTNFVAVILALSGVESIANMTGIMVQPIKRTAKFAIWPVIGEVVLLNLLLVLVVCSVPGLSEMGENGIIAAKPDAELTAAEHAIKEHVLEVVARTYVGPVFAAAAAIVFGLLLLSASNTAIIGMISIQYAMSRNRELPRQFGELNVHGVPWIALITAVALPTIVTVLASDLETLASLYAIGVVGAIVINLGSCAYNGKLPIKGWERGAMWGLAGFLGLVWVTIAGTNLPALAFITFMLASGLGLRLVGQRLPKPVPSERPAKATMTEPAEGLPALPLFDPGKPKILVASRGNQKLVDFAFDEARRRDANLFVLFVRDIAVMFPTDEHPLTPQEDKDAAPLFDYAEKRAREHQVPLQSIYCVSRDPADVILDFSATYAADLVILGSFPAGRLVAGVNGGRDHRCG